MKRGLLAALTRWRTTITYYSTVSEPYKRLLRLEVRAIEHELRENDRYIKRLNSRSNN